MNEEKIERIENKLKELHTKLDKLEQKMDSLPEKQSVSIILARNIWVLVPITAIIMGGLKIIL
ncbi:hypothetical protein [Terrilactibacillus laevilacticus]|uniref:Uncharacterized protein n=1 Tax=Terrilactibacillus laevilacticus TaxID=1380157 RepID=A0ABW5PM71_9BACI|nr:hypothetical protein [Terrilactibacillus laevilacticus]